MGRVPGQRVVVAGFGLMGAVVGAVLGLGSGQAPPPVSVGGDTAAPVASLVPVHVSGWVTSPGVVWVADGSLTVTVIEAAGGALPGARLDDINLAQPVYEGDQIQVPGPDSPGSPDASDSGGLIDINTADETELQQLPGVGPVLAGRIVAHREAIGRFDSVEDLLDVPGIGETRLASIRDLILPP